MEQEFSRKLLYSPDFFFRFNVRSLYNYSLEETIKAGAEMVDRMAMTRNEWRSWIGLPPSEGMDILEGCFHLPAQAGPLQRGGTRRQQSCPLCLFAVLGLQPGKIQIDDFFRR